LPLAVHLPLVSVHQFLCIPERGKQQHRKCCQLSTAVCVTLPLAAHVPLASVHQCPCIPQRGKQQHSAANSSTARQTAAQRSKQQQWKGLSAEHSSVCYVATCSASATGFTTAVPLHTTARQTAATEGPSAEHSSVCYAAACSTTCATGLTTAMARKNPASRCAGCRTPYPTTPFPAKGYPLAQVPPVSVPNLGMANEDHHQPQQCKSNGCYVLLADLTFSVLLLIATLYTVYPCLLGRHLAVRL
jgi:hypothetical protein